MKRPCIGSRISILLIVLAGVALPLIGQNAAKPAKAAVTVDGQTLFFVQERVFSFSPEDRAAAIEARIQRLAKDPLQNPAAISVSDSDTSTDIVAGDLVIMSVTDRDALLAGMSRQQLAAQYAETIKAAALRVRKDYSWKSLLFGALYTLLATAVLWLVLFLFRRIFPKLYRKVRSWQGTKIRSIRIQNFEIIPAERITSIISGIARLVRGVISLVLFYFYLSLVFSFFPWTHGYAAILLAYISTPVRAIGYQIADYLPNLFFIAVILIVSYYISRFVRMIFREIGRGTITLPGFYPEWADPTYKIVRFLIIALTLVVVFPYLPGSKSPAFQGVSIFLGLLLSIGSSSAVANVVAGVILTYMRAFKPGDRVKIADTEGDVIEKNLLVTRVRTIKNVEITIANAMVLSSHIVNFSSSAVDRGLILHTGVTIGYDAPWRQVHELLIAAALETKNLQSEPKPFVLQRALDDFYVSYEINAYTDQPNQMAATYSELHQNIQDKFNQAGVEIMSPHYSSLRDGNATTIPSENLPQSYTPQPFRIAQVDLKAQEKKAGAE